MIKAEYKVGQPVRKVSGDYHLDGTVVGKAVTAAGKERIVVEHGNGMLHIYAPANLAPAHGEYAYLDLLRECLERGEVRTDRTGVGTRSLFGRHMRFDLAESFPLLTTKRVFFRGVVEELFWMLRGETNVRSLQEKGVHIWDAWAEKNGELGPIYGAQWREWGFEIGLEAFDQIAEAQRLIREDPTSRRIIVSAWNVSELDDMRLPPCHYAFQFSVRSGDRLDCLVTTRSSDVFLGLPFNIAQYALLTHLMAAVTDKHPGTLTINLGDVHLYENHVDQACRQLGRTPRPFPRLYVSPPPATNNVWDCRPEGITLVGYEPHPAIKAEVAV